MTTNNRTPNERAAALFMRQHGAASDKQLRAIGISWEVQRALIRRAMWARHSDGIVVVAGASSTWDQRAMIATLSFPKSLLSGGAGARLQDLDGFTDHQALEVVRNGSAHARKVEGVAVRYSRHLTTKDRHVVRSIPVTILPLTLLHLQSSGLAVEQALDSALRKGFKPQWLRDNLMRWQRPGVRGPAEVLAMLAERVDNRLPRSWFQRLASRLFESVGLQMMDEWPVYDDRGRLLAELDLALVELKVGVECQSWEHHGTPAARQRDTERKRKLTKLGWDIVEVWWSDLERAQDVLDDLRLAIHRAQVLSVSRMSSK